MSQCLDNWLNRLSKVTARTYRFHFNSFMSWVKSNGGKFAELGPDSLIEYQKGADNGTVYDILDLAQRYILSLKGKRKNTKVRYYSTIRSFFSHNRAELPKDPSFIIHGDIPKVQGTLLPENIRDMALSSKAMYRAIFLSMFQGALDLEMFQYWNENGWDALDKQLRAELEIIRIDLPGRKKNKNEKPYHTYVGSDAIKAINDYLVERGEGEAIFLNQYGDPITRNAVQMYWMRHIMKIGLIEKDPQGTKGTRYGKNIHEMRDVFRSLWEKSPAKINAAEYFMGHDIDPLDYNKAYRDDDWAREQYTEAVDYLQIMSKPEPYRLIDAKRVKELESELEEYRKGRNNEIEELKRMVVELQEERKKFVEIKTDEIYERLLARMEKDRVS